MNVAETNGKKKDTKSGEQSQDKFVSIILQAIKYAKSRINLKIENMIRQVNRYRI